MKKLNHRRRKKFKIKISSGLTKSLMNLLEIDTLQII